MLALVQNETLKVLRRKRFLVVIAILFAILALVTYGQYRSLQRRQNRNWRADVQQRIANYENTLRRQRIGNENWAQSLRAEIKRLQFYLDHDIEPNKPTAPLFVRGFADAAGLLLLPLLVAILGSDIVSAENSEGTDKLLLTRPVQRWKILTSKLITLWIFATLTLFCGAALAYGISAPFLSRGGWTAPTFTGFKLGNALELDSVRQLPLWKDTLIAYGLTWFALICVASISLMLSVIFKSSAAAIGTMLASLIGGTILTRVSPDWTAGKYLFVSALPLADYYTGAPPPYEDMTMAFCITLLAAWAVVTTVISYAIFVRRDVFG